MNCPFDPVTDLAFTKPGTVVGVSDIGLDQHGVSPVALAGPFPMFSEKAVRAMAQELLRKEVTEKCKYGSDPMTFQLRGACPELATYSNEAWTHPETLGIISRILQVDVIPVMPFEIAHVNVHLGGNKRDGNSIVKPQKDGYPFVCIVMLSDAGGEMELKIGRGEIIKAPRMSPGSAIILQGCYIEHYVPYCEDELITVVTSFRPSSPFLPDDTRLTAVRSISRTTLYYQFFEYRENIAIERMKMAIEMVSKWILEDLLEFVGGLIAFYRQTGEELVGEAEVCSAPSQSSDSPVSKSIKSRSLADPQSGLVPKLKNTLKLMVEMSKFQVEELCEWNIGDLKNFIAEKEMGLEKITRLF